MTNREAAQEWGSAHGYGQLVRQMVWKGHHVYEEADRMYARHAALYGDAPEQGLPALILARHGEARAATVEETLAIMAEWEKCPPIVIDDTPPDTTTPEYEEARRAINRVLARKSKRWERKRQDRPR